EHTIVDISVSGNIQRARVRQVYGNPYDEVIEAVYTFPLPESGAVDRMDMWIGDRLVHGEIHERDEARTIYEQAISAGRTAALLEQERPNIFTQSVGNILPGDSIVIDISYVAPVEYDSGEYELSFPTVVGPRFVPPGAHTRVIFGTDTVQTSVADAHRITPPIVPEGTRPGYDIEISVTIDAGVAVMGLSSLNHEIDWDIDEDGVATVELRNEGEIPNRDFVLSYRTSAMWIQTGVLAHNDQLGGHFMLVMQPDVDVPVSRIAPKEMFFVIDCSGSMSGFPMDTARETVRTFVRGMNPGDSFQIMRFSETASSMSPAPLAYDPENIERGIEYIERLSGQGGTMMIEGIRAAVGYPEDPDRMRFIIFLTDGYIGNESEILAELESTLGPSTRLFSIGVGSSTNRYLIEGLAEAGLGQAFYVGLGEDPTEAVSTIYEKINNPYLVNISVDWGDLGVHDVYPSRVPDLFAGQPLVVVGQYERGGSDRITINGTLAGRPWSSELDVDLPAYEPDHDVVATLWARRKIHELSNRMNDPYRPAPPGIVEEITQTALDYQIVSQYTSFVAVSEEVRVDSGGQPVTVAVPVNMPDGVSYQGVFGNDGAEGGYMPGAHTFQYRGMAAGESLCCTEEIAPEVGWHDYQQVEPRASIWSVAPGLGLAPSEIRVPFDAVMEEVGEAYRQYVDALPEDQWIPQGSLTFLIRFGDDGRVLEASVLLDETGDPEVAELVLDILRDVVIPVPPDGGGTVQVGMWVYPY
ncbi:VWA domain-containing protein, partial [Candidatus Fermentibacterales bacterium]|nr:VWA domain-containing protein [Candidatus Fermentibacterales bacterium]